MDFVTIIICLFVSLALGIIQEWRRQRKDKIKASGGTCRSERVMFTPDAKRPCWTFIDSLKKNQQQAPEPCELNCKSYHGWSQEKPCAQAEVLRTLSTAKKSIYLCVSTFNDIPMNRFLEYLRLVKKVEVFMLTDCQSRISHQNDHIFGLEDAGIAIRWNSRVAKHNKYCIVDRKIMILGSPDWTTAHHDNDDDSEEMIMWIENQEIIGRVLMKFVNYFNTGETRPSYVLNV